MRRLAWTFAARIGDKNQIRLTWSILFFLLFDRNDPKFSDRQVWTGAVWSGSTLFAILSASFGGIGLWKNNIVQILEWLQQFFQVSEFWGFLW